MSRLLITGSREWADADLMERSLAWAWRHLGATDDIVLVHGAARGADVMAAGIWERRCYLTEEHPAAWRTLGRHAGPIRNAHMVALGADLCLAFPLGTSPGTRGCMLLADTAGIPVVEVGPDGPRHADWECAPSPRV